MKKIHLLMIGSIAVLLVAVILLLVFNRQSGNEHTYSAVYLSTGEMYIGRLALFPRMALTDAYVLQITKDPKDQTKNNFQITPLTNALWDPKKIYLLREQVIFYGPLSETSAAAEALRTRQK